MCIDLELLKQCCCVLIDLELLKQCCMLTEMWQLFVNDTLFTLAQHEILIFMEEHRK